MPRQRFGYNLNFANKDELYQMTPKTTLEMHRMRECRKMMSDLIALMQEQEWIREDSPAVKALEDAWLSLWNEYMTMYQATLDDEAKNNLFTFLPGTDISEAKNKMKLKIGDVILVNCPHEDFNNVVWDVIDLRKIKSRKTGETNSISNTNLAYDYKWTYIGRKNLDA